MAFFDDLSKKISQAGQTAVQKTKEMTDIARINGIISDEERKVNNSYYQIGKLYVAMHPADYETDFAGMIAIIKESEQRIVECRQQIQDIKGVVRCEQCGAEVASGVAFCSACGTPMPTQEQVVDENMVKCPGCGQMVSKGMRFCTSCGKLMNDIGQNQTLQSAETNDSAKICPECGVELGENVAFCTECGAKL